MQPKIAIGCPIRNRAWVLPEYLDALEKVEYENKMYLFLENDSDPDEVSTTDIIIDFADKCKKTGQPIRWNSIFTDVEHWQRGDYAHNQYANLANVRNQFLEMFLRTDADYLLSVDSDVIVPPDIVERLLEHAQGQAMIIGAAISNVPDKQLDGITPGNWMLGLSHQVVGDPIAYYHPAHYELEGTHPVDLIGAVYLIPRSAIEDGARYAPHGQGEDIPFCQAAQRLGYRLMVNMDVKCEHRMTREETE